MVWSEQTTERLVVPSDKVDGDGKDAIIVDGYFTDLTLGLVRTAIQFIYGAWRNTDPGRSTKRILVLPGSSPNATGGNDASVNVRAEYTEAGVSHVSYIATFYTQDGQMGCSFANPATITTQGTDPTSLVRRDYLLSLVNQPDTAWLVPTLINSWHLYSVSFVSPKYRKLSNGQVEIQGLVTGGTNFSNICQLPVGYRPLERIPFNFSGFGRIDVLPDGNVLHQGGDPLGAISIGALFYADQ